MKFRKLLVLACVALFASPSYADLFGPSNGRTANLDNMAERSVEGAANLGGDVNYFGVRGNYKVNPDIMVYGDLGRASLFSTDGFVFGGGVFYQVRQFKDLVGSVAALQNSDFALKAGFRTGSLEIDGCVEIFGIDCDLSASEIALDGILSGDQLGSTSFAWYANAGLHILDNSTEIQLGGGIVSPLAFGEWYAGLELVDRFQITAGVRYNLP